MRSAANTYEKAAGKGGCLSCCHEPSLEPPVLCRRAVGGGKEEGSYTVPVCLALAAGITQRGA